MREEDVSDGAGDESHASKDAVGGTRQGNRDWRWRSMRRKFRLGDVMIALCHRHGKKDTSKGRVDT